MSSIDFKKIKPLFSVSMIIITLFSVVFFQMEERRLGYSLLKITREYRKVAEQKKTKEIMLAQITRPQWVEKMAASRLTLKRAESHQIILLPGVVSSLENGDLFE